MSGIRVTLFTREGQIINTTDGTEPHVANGFVYKSDNPLVITKTTTVCAVAYAGSTPEVCVEYQDTVMNTRVSCKATTAKKRQMVIRIAKFNP